MSQPFSKLQRKIYNLIDPKLNLQIHCVAYRMPKSQSHNPQIPRYFITLDKQIIFDFPKQSTLADKHLLYEHIPNISTLIQSYADSSKEGLMERVFENDVYGLTDILKASDRRIGKRQLTKMQQLFSKDSVVSKIISLRL